jgi:hypothetical protein
MSKKFLIKSALAGVLLLTSGASKLKSLPQKPPELRLPQGLITSEELKKLLSKLLKKELPESQRLLTNEEEEKVEAIIRKKLGFKVGFSLEGNRLNNQWGLMGLEQHLARFAGDTMAGRDFAQVGMAPGRGAFGYFATAQQEKYYVAVQTLYLPEWAKQARTLKDWYKFRKIVAINPETGAAVVAVIGDAGPAKFTGRQFGGSPQVMHDLDFYPKTHEGRVLLLFVDDPDNKVPLGPVNYPVNRPQPKLI